MRVVLFLLSCVPFFFGVVTAAEAVATTGLSSVAGLGLAADLFLVWAVLFSGAAILDGIVNASDKLKKMLNNPEHEP